MIATKGWYCAFHIHSHSETAFLLSFLPYASFVTDMDGCEVWKMEQSYAGEIKPSASCGILLSPWFPGYVEPGYWAWLVEGLDNFYFDIYVYYVRGPELPGEDCGQYFQSKQ